MALQITMLSQSGKSTPNELLSSKLNAEPQVKLCIANQPIELMAPIRATIILDPVLPKALVDVMPEGKPRSEPIIPVKHITAPTIPQPIIVTHKSEPKSSP